MGTPFTNRNTLRNKIMLEHSLNLSQEVLFGDDVRKNMVTGLDLLARAVGATLGPSGRNVVIIRDGKPHLTKDGVTVAKSIQPTDKAINMAVSFVKEVSKRACNDAGDGTTTATVLAHAITHNALAEVEDHVNVVYMARGMNYAADVIQRSLMSKAIPCDTKDQIVRIATISANGDWEIGSMVGEAMAEAGQYGYVIVRTTNANNTTVEKLSGMRLDYGYVTPAFVNNRDNHSCEVDDVHVLLIDGKLESMGDYNKLVLDVINGRGNGNILIVANEFGDEATAQAIQVNLKLKRKAVCLVRSSGHGQRRKDMLRDLAAYTNGVVTGTEGDIPASEFTIDMLGHADSIVQFRKRTIISSTAGDRRDIKERMRLIELHLQSGDLSAFETSRMRERMGLLQGQVITINVGADTEIELLEIKDRFDDAVCAVNSARELGILPGGGVALLNEIRDDSDTFTKDNESFRIGYRAVMNSLKAPMEAIVRNTGNDADEIIRNIQTHEGNANYGFDAARGVYCDMIEQGILDPAKVTISAIKYSVAIAAAIVTTEVAILG